MADSLTGAMDRDVLVSGWRCESPEGECII